MDPSHARNADAQTVNQIGRCRTYTRGITLDMCDELIVILTHQLRLAQRHGVPRALQRQLGARNVVELKFGDIVDLSSTSFGLNVGKSFGLLGVSGGLQSDGGTMKLSYTSTDPNGPGQTNVDLDVERALRFRAGALLSLGFLRLFGDAAFGDVTSYAAGLRFGF